MEILDDNWLNCIFPLMDDFSLYIMKQTCQHLHTLVMRSIPAPLKKIQHIQRQGRRFLRRHIRGGKYVESLYSNLTPSIIAWLPSYIPWKRLGEWTSLHSEAAFDGLVALMRTMSDPPQLDLVLDKLCQVPFRYLPCQRRHADAQQLAALRALSIFFAASNPVLMRSSRFFDVMAHMASSDLGTWKIWHCVGGYPVTPCFFKQLLDTYPDLERMQSTRIKMHHALRSLHGDALCDILLSRTKWPLKKCKSCVVGVVQFRRYFDAATLNKLSKLARAIERLTCNVEGTNALLSEWIVDYALDLPALAVWLIQEGRWVEATIRKLALRFLMRHAFRCTGDPCRGCERLTLLSDTGFLAPPPDVLTIPETDNELLSYSSGDDADSSSSFSDSE